ncbi:CRISPR-associated protein Cas4 [Roseospira marina]|nr:CRISPR-associated protein Cas4 [Roseospira marina]MBB4312991.1 CRISPR-associated exonuclease Cas4 [Roseospira marina]MBB5086235.1 CRISPR-associated exonuclease Cas4 [Roseospira marina]
MTTDPVPIAALQHMLYCARQCALIHVERVWEENRLTAEGRVLHDTVDQRQQHRRRGVRVVTALPVYSLHLGLSGIADVVEFHQGPEGETPYPVEYKRGRPKAHRADAVQLCAQALCLEEMTGRPVSEGALFYGETRRRQGVAFDTDLRALTEDTVTRVKVLLAETTLPPPTEDSRRCRACSLNEPCRPDLAGRSAHGWWTRRVERLMAGDDADSEDDLP